MNSRSVLVRCTYYLCSCMVTVHGADVHGMIDLNAHTEVPSKLEYLDYVGIDHYRLFEGELDSIRSRYETYTEDEKKAVDRLISRAVDRCTVVLSTDYFISDVALFEVQVKFQEKLRILNNFLNSLK